MYPLDTAKTRVRGIRILALTSFDTCSDSNFFRISGIPPQCVRIRIGMYFNSNSKF